MRLIIFISTLVLPALAFRYWFTDGILRATSNGIEVSSQYAYRAEAALSSSDDLLSDGYII